MSTDKKQDIPKVYLAKSNAANPDEVMKVRKILQQLPVEIVEFSGGTYTHEPMLKCDYLIIIPPVQQIDSYKPNFTLGKGTFKQFETFIDENYLDKVLVLYDDYCYSVDEWEETEDNWAINWGNLDVDLVVKGYLIGICDMLEIPLNDYHLIPTLDENGEDEQDSSRKHLLL